MTEHATSALAIRNDQTEFTEQQLTALRAIWQGKQPPPGDLLRFLTLCQQTGLSPFANQIYLIERGGRWSPQTSIDGFRVVRDRVAHARGLMVGYHPSLYCGPDGVWTSAWLQNGPPAAAQVTVTITSPAGQADFPQVALWREYGSDSSMWRRMPTTMLAKVAEAQALRRAFPHDLSGVYTADEMAQADPVAEQPTSPAPEPLDLEPVLQGMYGSVIAAATEDELRACWHALRDHPNGRSLAERPVTLPVAWQDDGQPSMVELHQLIKIARSHLDDTPLDDAPAESWPETRQPAEPDVTQCAYHECTQPATVDALWCDRHEPVRENDNNPRVDPEHVELKGKAAMAKARADLAARQAAKEAQK